MNGVQYLFNDNDLRAVLAGQDQHLTREIEEIDPDEFLRTSPGDLADHFVAKFTVEIPELLRGPDDISVDHREAKVDVSQDWQRAISDRSRPFYLTGTEYTFHIPFNGDAEVFGCSPSSFTTSGRPIGRVDGDRIVLTYTELKPDAKGLRAQLDRDLDRIEKHLEWVKNDVKHFNESLSENARARIDARRERLLADRGIAASLGFKMRERDNAPRTYAVPTKRRKPPIERPRPKATEPFQPEPELAMKEYEHILDILSNMVSVMERSPGAFRGMEEEHLRQHFLVQLNAQYEGQATGETFNFEGKTDILVRVDGRNVFIAECKFWRGPKSLTQTVDQILGYATWRDTKTAILLFNRTKNLSSVLASVPETMEAHPNFKRAVSIDGETRFRYVFAHRDDPNRELIITVLVFEVPV